jgi:TIR domain
MAYRVFLSHSEADKQWVEWIRANAQNIGVEAYMYEYDSQPGTFISNKIQTAIENSHALIVLLTSNSQFSPYVQQEIGYALSKQKAVIPLVQPGVSPKALAMLQGREYIPFNTAAPKEALSQLLGYLKKLKESKESDEAILIGFGTLLLIGIIASQNK